MHGDYRLDNCLMALADPSRVTAVLDWELSTLGDPLTDLGLLLFYWREPGRTSQHYPCGDAEPRLPEKGPSRGTLCTADRRTAGRHRVLRGVRTFQVCRDRPGHCRAGGGRRDGWQDFGNLDHEVLKIAEEGLIRLEQES